MDSFETKLNKNTVNQSANSVLMPLKKWFAGMTELAEFGQIPYFQLVERWNPEYNPLMDTNSQEVAKERKFYAFLLA